MARSPEWYEEGRRINCECDQGAIRSVLGWSGAMGGGAIDAQLFGENEMVPILVGAREVRVARGRRAYPSSGGVVTTKKTRSTSPVL